MSDPILQPVALPPSCVHVPACVYFSSHPFWGSGSGPQPSLCVARGLGCAGSSLWILLAIAGVPAVPRSQHPCARAHLFAFPPPLVGTELGREHGSCSFFVSGLPPREGWLISWNNLSHKVPCYKFSMGSQDPSKPREGKTEIKDKAGPGREQNGRIFQAH
jgi:hypothetical protein